MAGHSSWSNPCGGHRYLDYTQFLCFVKSKLKSNDLRCLETSTDAPEKSNDEYGPQRELAGGWLRDGDAGIESEAPAKWREKRNEQGREGTENPKDEES